MKGIIAEVSGKRAVILLENGEFETIPNNNYKVGQKTTYQPVSFKKYTTLAACILCTILIGCGGYTAYATPVSYIDIDTKASVRLSINAFNKVIDVTGLNDEAKTIVSDEKFPTNIDECITAVITKSKENDLIQDGENVDLVVISDNEKVYNKAQESVQTASESSEIEVCVKKETSKQLDAANELNISVGRYLAIEEYSNKAGGSVEENSQKLKDKSNSDIKKISSEYKTEGSEKEKLPSSEIQTEIETTTQPTTTQKQSTTTKATQKRTEYTKQTQQTKTTQPSKPTVTQPQTQPNKTQPTQTQPTTTKHVDKNSDVKLPNINPDYDDDEWDDDNEWDDDDDEWDDDNEWDDDKRDEDDDDDDKRDDDDERDDDDNKYENDNNKNNDWNLNNIKDFFGSLHDKFGFED